MIVAGPQLYRQLAGNDGSYEFYLGLRPGADVTAVRHQIQAELAAKYPQAVVLTQSRMRNQIGSIAARLVSAFIAFSCRGWRSVGTASPSGGWPAPGPV